MTIKTISTAVELAALGYGPYLIPITNPHESVAPNSGLDPTHMGKAPGIKVGEKLWVGAEKWTVTYYDPAYIDSMKGNVGIRTGELVAIDVDVYDRALAESFSPMVVKHFDQMPVSRIGEAPKIAYLCRWEGPLVGKQSLAFSLNGKDHKVELLAVGQQLVMLGDHARTLKPYLHPNGIPHISELPVVNQQMIDSLFAEITNRLSMDRIGVSPSGSRSPVARPEVDQESLTAPIERIAEALANNPNTKKTHPSRESWVYMCYAIKAATIHDPVAGFNLFALWSRKYGPENTPEAIQQLWDSAHPPFWLGAEYVYSDTRRFGWSDATHDFDPIPGAEPPPPEPKGCRTRHSDIWMRDKLIDAYGDDIRWVRSAKEWYCYQEDIWVADPGIVRGHAIELCSKVAATINDKRKAQSIASAHTVRAISQLAEDSPVVQASLNTFNSHPDLMGIPGGIVDLRSGLILPPDRAQYISRRTSVAPRPGPTPMWDRFLLDCVGGMHHVADYLQRMVGYCCTGRIEEHVFWQLWGGGGNGKGTFLNTLTAILGDYAATAAMDTFMDHNGATQHPVSIASLAGARLVQSQETKPGQRWNETLLKSLSGGDPITARFMFANPFTFIPTFKIVFSGNHQPHITSVGEALRRRFHVIPFTHTPPVLNKRLADQLKEEYPSILAWAIDGARLWYAEGLQPPEEVLLATSDYLDAEDTLGRWLDQCCVRNAELAGPSGALYLCWKDWCFDQGLHEGSVVVFAKKLTERGFQSNRKNKGVTRDGLDLVPELKAKYAAKKKEEPDASTAG